MTGSEHPYIFGVSVFHAPRVPFVSLGIHIDWHTPTIDLHVGRTQVLIGRNQWNGKRFTFDLINEPSGHTDHCRCKPVHEWTPMAEPEAVQ